MSMYLKYNKRYVGYSHLRAMYLETEQIWGSY